MSVELYSYWRSSASWRVRLVLAIKGIQYEYKEVNLLQSAQLQENYSVVNPMKAVPTLKIDGHLLGQSVAIVEYLEETRPDPPLFPKDAYLRAKVRQIIETIASDIHPIQNLKVLKKVGEDKKAEWAKFWIEAGFDGLEKILKETAGKYCVGDTLTLADCFLIPQVYNSRRWSVDLSKYPTIVRLEEEISKLPAFKQAHADSQPDAVKV